MVHLPSLSNNPWQPVRFADWRNNAEHDYRVLGIQEFGMYYVDYKHVPTYGKLREDVTYPQPFFHRTPQGNILFPHSTHHWMWGAELIGALPYNHWDDVTERPMIRVYRGMELSNYDVAHPYAFVQEMYDARLQMKAEGKPEEVAIKLGLNSLYGKMAQQKGYKESDARPWFEQMPWHQFDWAGFVTAHNRARIYEMALLAAQRGILISIETDAIFTSEPMPELEPGSNKLGEWGVETFDDIICLQSGVYLTLNDGKWSLKYRGFDEDSVTVDDVLKYLETTSLYHHDPDEYARNALEGMTTRFIGAKLARTRAFGMEDDWRVWKTEPKKVTVGYSGKRVHSPLYCRACLDGEHYGATRMHDMTITPFVDHDSESFATPLPWREIERQADPWLPELEGDDFDLDGITE
jgi:hypothetical protein